ncbi:hypothetical protein HID58_008092 [Brassica napus]|uniref:Protein root UVB sensitive/RUS domain-containing protein n=1 Tax=Brassica napus TaxID=3708 RepID=A0ABQ8DNN8_BRANA|nr:hypothetical protein HID58_008092 [Brassica napus]
MHCTLRLPLPLHIPRTRTTSSSKPKRRRVEEHYLRCRCAQSSEEEGTDDKRVEGVVSIVVERYGNGTSKRSSAFNAFPQDFKLTCLVCRYLLDDDDSPLQGFLEEREPKPDTNSNSSETNTVWVPDVVKDFVFPTGFPGSVSDDYLDYMLWQFPTNVTGWMCNVLVTSSLLKASHLSSLPCLLLILTLFLF